MPANATLEPLLLSPAEPQQTDAFLVDAAEAARLLGISRTLFYQLTSSGRVGPRKISLGPRCSRWSVKDLRNWAEAGCPSRSQWLKEVAH